MGKVMNRYKNETAVYLEYTKIPQLLLACYIKEKTKTSREDKIA